VKVLERDDSIPLRDEKKFWHNDARMVHVHGYILSNRAFAVVNSWLLHTFIRALGALVRENEKAGNPCEDIWSLRSDLAAVGTRVSEIWASVRKIWKEVRAHESVGVFSS
jgi:hypothetical protein